MTRIQQAKADWLEKILAAATQIGYSSPVRQYRLKQAYKVQSLARLKDTARSFGLLPFED